MVQINLYCFLQITARPQSNTWPTLFHELEPPHSIPKRWGVLMERAFRAKEVCQDETLNFWLNCICAQPLPTKVSNTEIQILNLTFWLAFVLIRSGFRKLPFSFHPPSPKWLLEEYCCSKISTQSNIPDRLGHFRTNSLSKGGFYKLLPSYKPGYWERKVSFLSAHTIAWRNDMK